MITLLLVDDQPAVRQGLRMRLALEPDLQIIGEAARALPEDVRALAPEIPWSEIIGMRNILVHGYFDIDTDIVWEAATRDVPAIKPAVERLLETLEEQSR